MKFTAILIAGLAVAGTAIAEPALQDMPSLKAEFADDFLVGAALGEHQIRGLEPGALALVEHQFNALTAENVMKWAELQPIEGEYDWEAADLLADFARDRGMHVTGHTLLWHQQTPGWVFEDENGGTVSRERLLQRLENHINAVVGRYKDRVRAWDVVNEALNDDGSMRDTPWYRILGEDYVVRAFEMARAADPTATLLYNDYNLFQPAKRAGAIRLLQAVEAAGVKVDGVGLQGHYGLDNPRRLEDVADSITAFAAAGWKSSITELDIAVLPFPPSAHWGADLDVNLELSQQYNPWPDGLPEDIAALQAERYQALFALLLEHRRHVERVTFWGVHDGHSWKNNWPMRGRTEYPLLFDRQLLPKAAFWSVTALKFPATHP